MLSHKKIDQIASSVARANISRHGVRTVFSEPTSDLEGKDALRITIVVTPDAVEKLKGDAALNTLVQIVLRLQSAGEERFPYIEYSTEDELEAIVDS